MNLTKEQITAILNEAEAAHGRQFRVLLMVSDALVTLAAQGNNKLYGALFAVITMHAVFDAFNIDPLVMKPYALRLLGEDSNEKATNAVIY